MEYKWLLFSFLNFVIFSIFSKRKKYWSIYFHYWASLEAQWWRIHLPMQKIQVWSLDSEMATHSSILGWEIPWTKEPGGLQSVGSQRVRHDWTTEHTHVLYTYFKVLRFPWECQFHRAKVASDASQPVLDFSWCSDRKLMEKDHVTLFCYSNSE